jgi:hypothetical protein
MPQVPPARPITPIRTHAYSHGRALTGARTRRTNSRTNQGRPFARGHARTHARAPAHPRCCPLPALLKPPCRLCGRPILGRFLCRRRPRRAHLFQCRRSRRDAQPRRTRPGGARHNEYSRTHVGYSEYRDRSTHGVLGVLTLHQCLLPAQRCAVVAVAPPRPYRYNGNFALAVRVRPVRRCATSPQRPGAALSQHRCARAAPRRLVRGGVRPLHAQA